MFVPPELLALIIQQLGRPIPRPDSILSNPISKIWSPLYHDSDSKQVLSNLCLTSRTCRASAVPILYHNIVVLEGLDIAVMDRRVSCFLNFIRTSIDNDLTPRAFDCIRYLAIKVEYAGLCDWHLSPEDEFVLKELYQSPKFITLLDSFTGNGAHIRGFHLPGPVFFADRCTPWVRFSLNFQQAVNHLIRANQLDTLSFANICHLPPSIFNGLSIKSVCVASSCHRGHDSIHHWPESENGAIYGTDVETEALSLPPPQFNFLRTDHGFDFSAKELNWESTRTEMTISGLTLPYQRIDHLSAMNKLLKLIYGSLRHLGIKYSYIPLEHRMTDGTFYRPIVNLSTLPVLHSLTLSISPSVFSANYNPNFDPGLAKVIQLLDGPSCNTLDTLTLELHFDIWTTKEDFLVPTQRTVSLWEKMDLVLASGKYPALQHFQLVIWVTYVASPELPAPFDNEKMRNSATELFNASFGRVRALGNVKMKWSIDDILISYLGRRWDEM